MDNKIEIMSHFRNAGTGIKTLLALAGIAIVLTGIRFVFGIGSISNLTDGYPWGIWIGFDVMSGVALAAGGFTTAALVHIFGREKYHAAVRPAILTAFLGYVLVVVGLVVDLGRPWALWNLFINWNSESALAEVGWCVMLYTTVLAIEFLPTIIEKYKRNDLMKVYEMVAPWASVLLVSLFVMVMTKNIYYTGIVFIILSSFLIFFGLKLAKSGTMLLVYMSGVIFSTAHQSSLGTLMLLADTKLNGLWQTPFLPINFYFSAIAVGFGMVIFESTMSARGFGIKPHNEMTIGLGKILAWILAAVIAFRVFTIWQQTGFKFDATPIQMTFFAIEFFGGLVLPMILLAISKDAKTTFWGGSLVVFLGVVLNRFNVSFIAFTSPEYAAYWPHPFEILVSAGVVSIGVLVFYLVVKNFPVMEHDAH